MQKKAQLESPHWSWIGFTEGYQWFLENRRFQTWLAFKHGKYAIPSKRWIEWIFANASNAVCGTFPETPIAPSRRERPFFQPSIFWCYVRFKEGIKQGEETETYPIPFYWLVNWRPYNSLLQSLHNNGYYDSLFDRKTTRWYFFWHYLVVILWHYSHKSAPRKNIWRWLPLDYLKGHIWVNCP